jgi:hypothetical protein
MLLFLNLIAFWTVLVCWPLLLSYTFVFMTRYLINQAQGRIYLCVYLSYLTTLFQLQRIYNLALYGNVMLDGTGPFLHAPSSCQEFIWDFPVSLAMFTCSAMLLIADDFHAQLQCYLQFCSLLAVLISLRQWHSIFPQKKCVTHL